MTAYVRFRNALAWHTFEEARAFARAGHHVKLYCQLGSPLARWTETESFAVNRDFNLNHFSPAVLWQGLQDIRKTLREFKPDILNPHCPPGHTFLAVARKMEGLDIPLVRTVADPRSPAGNPFNKYLHERATNGLIYSTRSSQVRYEQAFQLSRVQQQVILPGFRPDEFVSATPSLKLRERFQLRPEQLLIGIIARMSPEKGQEVLLKALSLLKPEERNQLFCVLAGEDSRERGKQDLQELAKSLGVEKHVAFLGWLDSVQPVIAELDLGMITSTRSEAVCRIALEYMSYQLPVISSDVNILPEVVLDGENGWVFPNHNAQALAHCIRHALTSPNECKKRGQRGLELVQTTFSIDHQLEQTFAYYQNLQNQTGIR